MASGRRPSSGFLTSLTTDRVIGKHFLCSTARFGGWHGLLLALSLLS